MPPPCPPPPPPKVQPKIDEPKIDEVNSNEYISSVCYTTFYKHIKSLKTGFLEPQKTPEGSTKDGRSPFQ
jgi:hypothetical protein